MNPFRFLRNLRASRFLRTNTSVAPIPTDEEIDRVMEASEVDEYELLASKCTLPDGTRRPWVYGYTREDAVADLEDTRPRPHGFSRDRWRRILNKLEPHLALEYEDRQYLRRRGIGSS